MDQIRPNRQNRKEWTEKEQGGPNRTEWTE